MSRSTFALDQRVSDYIQRVTVRDDDVLRRLREETGQLPNAMMQISPEQGQFMQVLVRMLNAKKTIEVGTFTGYSALCVARALPADGRVVAGDVSEEWTSIGRRYWQEAGVAERVDLRLGPGDETLERLIADGGEGTYDFAFIDADKTGYDRYYELCLRLLRPGGVIAIDNVLWGGRVADDAEQDADTAAIRALNEKIAHDDRVDQSLVPIGDGLTLALKR